MKTTIIAVTALAFAATATLRHPAFAQGSGSGTAAGAGCGIRDRGKTGGSQEKSAIQGLRHSGGLRLGRRIGRRIGFDAEKNKPMFRSENEDSQSILIGCFSLCRRQRCPFLPPAPTQSLGDKKPQIGIQTSHTA